MPKQENEIPYFSCAAGRHRGSLYSAVGDMPLLPLCREHWVMAYENPEELMRLTGKRWYLTLDNDENPDTIEIGENEPQSG